MACPTQGCGPDCRNEMATAGRGFSILRTGLGELELDKPKGLAQRARTGQITSEARAKLYGPAA